MKKAPWILHFVRLRHLALAALLLLGGCLLLQCWVGRYELRRCRLVTWITR